MAARLLLAVVAFYRRWLSPLKGAPSCRFLPTCSEFAHDAVCTHGALRGGALAFWRILRCNPFCRAGLDPVPPASPPHQGSIDGRLR
jgi:hypothetical protein